MAWRRQGDKPLSEPMMVSLPTHVCVTRPQWVNNLIQGVLSMIHSVNSCPLQWRHNEWDGVSNHQPHHCLPNRLFRSKKTSKLRVTGHLWGNSPVFPFDDVIMHCLGIYWCQNLIISNKSHPKLGLEHVHALTFCETVPQTVEYKKKSKVIVANAASWMIPLHLMGQCQCVNALRRKEKGRKIWDAFSYVKILIFYFE